MTRTGLFLSALGVAASACQATHAEASRPVTTAHVTPPVTTTTTTSHTVTTTEPPPPPRNVCVAIDKSKYELPPLETHVGTVTALPALPPLPAIVDDSHDLAPFYAKLAKLVRGKATDHVRIAVYGDSNLTMDYMTGAMRRLLQSKFGDGGHGYVAMARPWAWYHHMDVKQELSESKWTKISTSTDRVRDGHYGMANVATESDTAGAWSMIGTAPDTEPVGSKVSAIDVFYMKRPGGGSFGIKVDGEQAVTLSSASSESAATWEHFDMPDGAHKLELVVQSGNVRLLGASLERQTPSIVIDSLGTGALNYEQMQHVSDASRDPMLKRRKYDLVVFLIGTNLFAPGLHERWMEKDIGMLEAAVPHTPILILSPPDIELQRTDTHSDPRIVALQKQLGDIAKKHDWAYWNFWQAMGGDMSMMRFARVGLGTWDLVHLTRDGGFLMGDRFAHALFEGFEGYLKEHPDAGCDSTQ